MMPIAYELVLIHARNWVSVTQPIHTYTMNEAALFKGSHPLAKEVDDMVECIGDVSLKAELQCWRYEDTRLDYLQHEKDLIATEEWKLQLAHVGTT